MRADHMAKTPKNSLISVQILGNFDLSVGDQSVAALHEHPSRLRSLLCYLILHRDRAVTHNELIETFYSDEKQRDPTGALKMQILRLRTLLRPLLGDSVSPILGHRGSYQWNPALDCLVDAEQFESLCLAAEEGQKRDEERLSIYRRAIPLYRGSLHLEKSEPLWNRSLSARYFNCYLAAVQKYAALLEKCGDDAEVETICLHAITMDPLNESLYAPAMRAMLHRGKFTDARRHYLSLAELLHRELGVRPSEELQQLYSLCSKEDGPQEQDLSTVISSLSAHSELRGAFFCNFDHFKDIYQLEVRRIQRSGECMHVLMLTIMGANGKPLSAKGAKALMASVQESVLQSLRQSDVVAQCSINQFIILLLCADYENSVMVSRRIMDTYYANNPQSAARLVCQIREPELL